jgi:multidrug resistance protein, MATE family
MSESPTISAPSASCWGIVEIMRLAVPSVLTTISLTIMLWVDSLMVSRASDVAIENERAMAAQLAGGMASFTSFCFFLGVLSCVSTFASQHLGAGRREQAALYGWQGIWLAVAGAAVLALLIPLAGPVLSFLGHGAEVHALEVPYFQIMMSASVFVLITAALGSFFVGLHKPKIPFVASLLGNAVNFVAAYGLIFGEFGLPHLGLIGAGLGSLIGMAVQAGVLGWYFMVGPESAELHVRRQCRVAGSAMLELLRMGAPAGLMFLGDVLMWTIFMSYVMGWFGVSALAATAILNRYWHVCFMPAIGVGNAISAIVGKYCGAGLPRLAARRAYTGLVLVELYMVSMGVTMWLFRDKLVGIFNKEGDPAIQSLAAGTFIFILLCQAFDALNVIFISSLRGAGDTLWPSLVQLVLGYGLGLGGAVTVAKLFPEWGVYGPWSVASVYIATLGLVMWLRFLSGRWRTMAVVETPPTIPDSSDSIGR